VTTSPDSVVRHTVLVVDDIDDARELFGYVLRWSGFQVIEAANGSDAVRQAAAHVPSVILMDLFMPGVDGVSAARQIKDDPRLRHIPIIAWTARPSVVDNHPALFAAVVAKPGTPDAILGVIRSLLPA
jgi:CheY-like chemotaxis protein